MGKNRALDAVTSNNPSDRQQYIKNMAENCERRFPYSAQPNVDDVWYVLLVTEHWDYLSNKELESFTRRAVGSLVADIRDAWQLVREMRR